MNQDSSSKASTWLEAESEKGFPSLLQGDVYLSFSFSFISRAIGFFQGRPGGSMPSSPPWSHVALYAGSGNLVEATYPRARVYPLRKMISAGNVVALIRPGWKEAQRRRVIAEAMLFVGRRYDTSSFGVHLLDNLVERLTWNQKKQEGARPFSRAIGDLDHDRRLICSELVERSILNATGEEISKAGDGSARPIDVWTWLRRSSALPIYWISHGLVSPGPPREAWQW